MIVNSFMNQDFIIKQIEKENFYRLKAQDQSKYSLIITGDSRSLYALDPKIISKELNLKDGKNFAFLSNSYTKSYLNYIEQKIQEKSVVILPISFESLTRLEEDRSFQNAHKNKNSFLHKITKFIDYSWPGKKIINFLKNRSTEKKIDLESYEQSGEIDRKKSFIVPNIPLENHYLNVMQNFNIESVYVSSIAELISNKKANHFYLFHICFLERICPTEKQKLAEIFNSFKKYPNVTILEIDQKFLASDGDHLDQDVQEQFSNFVANLIKNSNSF